MTLPTFLFSLLIAMLIGALYHLLRGGGGWRLVLYLIASIVGFMCGQAVGSWREWHFFMLGSINLGMGTLGSLLFLIGIEWLSRIDVNRESSV